MVKTIKLPTYFEEVLLCTAYDAYDKVLNTPRKQLTLKDVFERMYSDEKLSIKTQQIIDSVGTPLYSKLKTRLPAFVLGRHHTQGNYKDTHYDRTIMYPYTYLSNYFAVDVDGFNNKEDMKTVFEALKQVPYLCCVFPSPSRLGFRAIVKTDFEAPSYEKATKIEDEEEKEVIVRTKFKPATEYILKCVGRDSSIPIKPQISELLESKNIKGKNQKAYIKEKGLYHIDVLKDVSRMWFFSSVMKEDADLIYINQEPATLTIDYSKIEVEKAKSKNYSKSNENQKFTGQSNKELDRFNDEFDLVNFLEEEGFARGRGSAEGILNMTSPNSSSAKSGDFVRNGAFGTQVFVNYSSSCELAKFKETSKTFTAYEVVKFLKFDGDKAKTFSHLNTLGFKLKEAKPTFGVQDTYYLTTDKNGTDYAAFDLVNFVKYLTVNGFRKVTNDESFDLIKQDGLICQKVTITYISDFVRSEILKTLSTDRDTAKLVMKTFITDFKKLFSEGVLHSLFTVEINTFQDTLNESFVMYQNGLVKITDGQLTVNSDKGRTIWVENAVDRTFDVERFNNEFDGFNFVDIHNLKDYKLKMAKLLENDFVRFCDLIMNNDLERFRQLSTVLGYLVNTYRDPTNPRAVIFCDENIADVPEGGSGKGLILKSIAKMRLTTSISGKNFDPANQFCFAGFKDNSNVLVIDDIVKHFDFENLFFYMTEGLVIRKLHQNPIMLDGANFPKIALTTNYTVLGDSSSHERRKIEVELHNYFNNERKPIDEFGKPFWSDKWTADDWFYFDSFMILCVKTFQKKGLYRAKSVNLDLRKMLQSTNIDFVDFIEETCKNGYSGYVKALLQDFKDMYSDFDNNKFKSRTFSKWLNIYLEYQDKNEENPVTWKIARRGGGMHIDIK